MRPRRPSSVLVVMSLACVALLTGCVAAGGAAPSDPRSGDGLKYGLAPDPNKGVTFDKNVVLVEGGAASVRSATADGLTWTLSPSAGGIADLAPGRVMFLTDRAVGQVRAVQNTPKGVVVTIAPASLTDIIHDGTLASNKPVPITNPIAVSSKGTFWADPALQAQAGAPAEQDDAGVPTTVPASFTDTPASPDLPRPPAPPAIVSDVLKADTGSFDMVAKCCDAGPGTTFDYEKDGLIMKGSVKLSMQKPEATFKLDIAGATFKSASVRITGAGSIQAALHAATPPGHLVSGYSPPLGTDFSFSVPMGHFFGVPLNLVVNQNFTVGVDIPGQATLDASGKVNLGAVLAFSYAGGKFTNGSKAIFDSNAALHATNSIAVGISYAVFNYNVRFTIGFGVGGFVVGLYLALGAHLVGAVGAPVGFNIAEGATDPIEHCRLVQGVVSIDYGIGYTIPARVAQVINFFLKAFKSEPIPDHGGLSTGWHMLAQDTKVAPSTAFCSQNK